MKLPVEQIVVGERRRQDYGDIAGLAQSIAAVGLIHPIVVDAQYNLVAGGRRLQACKSLGWTEVEARDFGELTPTQLREIELEENLRRKDLTPGERSRQIVELKETAKTVAELLPQSSSNSNEPRDGAGRPINPVSDQQIANRIGVPRATVQKAQAHVAAMEKYPEVVEPTMPQTTAIRIAKILDEMPEPERKQKREELKAGSVRSVALPPKPSRGRASLPGVPKEDPGRIWHKKFQDVRLGVNAVRDLGGMKVIARSWNDAMKQHVVNEIDEIVNALTALRNELRA